MDSGLTKVGSRDSQGPSEGPRLPHRALQLRQARERHEQLQKRFKKSTFYLSACLDLSIFNPKTRLKHFRLNMLKNN